MRINSNFMEKYYPRVLIIHLSKVKADDGSNLLIRTQFGEWPKEKLAQIHSTAEYEGSGEFCGRYYKLNNRDRRFGYLFKKLRTGVFDSAYKKEKINKKNSIGVNIKKNIADLIINSGIWELIFSVRISRQMKDFVEEYQPEIIFCHGSTISFSTITLLISQMYKIPICIQNVDDWAYGRYVNSPVRWLLRWRAKELIKNSSVRLVFGDKMRKEYEKRYREKFDVTYHLDEKNRFNFSEKCNNNNKIKIIYTGSLELKRHEALYDLLLAVRSLNEYHNNIEIDIYTSNVPVDIQHELTNASEVSINPLPKHSELPSILSKANILFLPESFNQQKNFIEYSISTKAHLYMMSKKSIIVYGPKYSGTVEYAKSDGWAIVVTDRKIDHLKNAISELLIKNDKAKKIIENAEIVIEKNHNIRYGRELFYEKIKNNAKV
jgi:hypothetical protein